MNAAIREARLRAGLAQSQVAELIGPGVSAQAVSACCVGSVPRKWI